MRLFEYKQYFGVLLFLILLSLGVYFEGSGRLAMLTCALGLMLFLKEENVALCFFAQTFLCDSLELAPSLSFSSIAALVLIFKAFILRSKFIIDKKYYILLFIAIVIQLISTITFDNTSINVVRFGVNLFVLLYFTNYSEFFEKKSQLIVPSVISISVMFACLIGLDRSSSVDNLGIIRYSGIWIDDNFCGMYCAIGIVSSLFTILHNKYTSIFAIPCIVLAIAMGSLSMSRTFILVLLILAVFFTFSMLNNKSITGLKRIILIAICLVGVGFFMTRIAYGIFEQRGLDVGGDITNGRTEYSKQSLEAFSEHPFSWISGIGISNSANFKSQNGFATMASHNTYVDLIVELGIPFCIIAISIIFRFLCRLVYNIKRNIPYEGYLCLIVACYMGALTLGQYSILYIVIGIMINFTRNKIYNKNIQLNYNATNS